MPDSARVRRRCSPRIARARDALAWRSGAGDRCGSGSRSAWRVWCESSCEPEPVACGLRHYHLVRMTNTTPDALDSLVRLSHLLGRETRLVQPGGGNTSMKDGDALLVK